MSKKANNNNKDIFAVNEFKAVPTRMFEATHMQYVSADGEIVEIQISSDFKMIYSYLYDQQRSFAAQKGVDGEPQEMYQDWEYIFSFIGRKYKGDKNSMKIVKDLEASGLLIQTKRPNSTSTVKTVLDVTTIQTIKFSNAKHAECVNGAAARRTARQEQYAAAKKAKLAAIEEVKKRHQNNDCGVKDESGNEAKVDTVETPHDANAERFGSAKNIDVDVKPESIEPENKTNWELHSNALITQNDKYNKLNQGDKMRVMLAVNQCYSVSFKAIKEAFDITVDQLLAQAPKQTIKQVGRVCNGCYPVEYGNGWHCINSKCSNHNVEYEDSVLDNFDDVPF
ncbi:hypothetical protein [Aeromonas hydrophila]|uniref:hypothetical protein n=1 Tax=Aeromonas hydrophila TaxID=644 RepID=UPI0013B3E762|nr:hypothetical protein [Aeromonas hydrophila]